VRSINRRLSAGVNGCATMLEPRWHTRAMVAVPTAEPLENFATYPKEVGVLSGEWMIHGVDKRSDLVYKMNVARLEDVVCANRQVQLFNRDTYLVPQVCHLPHGDARDVQVGAARLPQSSAVSSR
jgi:hypothetical protein